jgi:hypothetical protein
MSIISKICSGYLRKQMNKCRVRLKLMWVSDLATGDGTSIRENVRKGLRDNDNNSNYQWPQQGDLPQNTWKEWEKILRLALGCSQSRGPIKLKTKLGRWLDQSYCDWFVCNDSERLYQRSTSKVFACTQKSKTRSGSKYTLINSSEPIPEASEGTTVFTRGNTIITEGCQPWIRNKVESSTNIQEFMRTKPQWEWLLPSFTFPSDDCCTLATAIQQGTCIAVSDSSFKDARGTALIVIEGHDSRFRLRCDVVVSGDASAQSSYRSELTGIMAAVNIIDLICEFFKITAGAVTMVCDGKSALERVFGTWSKPTFGKHFDLIIPTQLLLQRAKISWISHHVLGHQSGDSLDRFALLNCEMDEACKEYWQRTKNQRIQGYCNTWKVSINDKEITSDLQRNVYNACSSQLGSTYWERKLGQSQGMIDWSTTAAAMSESPRTKQQWISKHSSGFCGVGKMMYRTKEWPSPTCPRCDSEEDTEHVWICQHPEVQHMWETALEVLADWLRTQSTLPELSAAIIQGLNGWRRQSPAEHEAADQEVLLAAQAQHTSGWKNFFEGRPNYHWVKLQSYYFTVALKSRQSGKRWMTELIKKLWGVAWDLWEHRNGILHKKESQVLNLKLIQDLNQAWEDQRRLRLETKKGYPTSLAELLRWPTVKQEHWRNVIRIRIQQKERESRVSNFAAEREGLRRFLAGQLRPGDGIE